LEIIQYEALIAQDKYVQAFERIGSFKMLDDYVNLPFNIPAFKKQYYYIRKIY
jgi:hypothetical protein